MTTILFYPSAGKDLVAPLTHFQESISDFYFVDIGYSPLKLPPDYIVQRQCKVDITPSGVDWSSVDYQSRVLAPNGQSLTIHQIKGRGWTTLQNLNLKIDVFFYRGDSEGEGGSNTKWLSKTLFPRVVTYLQDSAWIVTDGSNGTQSKQWADLCFPYGKNLEPLDTLQAVRPFTYKNRIFTPTGFIAERSPDHKGSTLMWKVELILHT